MEIHIRKQYDIWLKNVKNLETREELERIADDQKEIEDRFYRILSFGTGGLRGIIGAGTNRMNIYTVGKAMESKR